MAAIKETLEEISGPERAALFMLAIGETHAAKLFAMMDHEEIRTVSQNMAHLGSVSAGVVEKLISQFADQLSSTGSLVGTLEIDRTAPV